MHGDELQDGRAERPPRAAAVTASEGAEQLLEVIVAEKATPPPFDIASLQVHHPIGSGGQGGVWLATVNMPSSSSSCARAVAAEAAGSAAEETGAPSTPISALLPQGGTGRATTTLAHNGRFVVALKQLRKGRLASLKKPHQVSIETCQWLIEREVLLECGSHPFIVTCYAAFHDAKSLFFALEHCEGGDLFGLLHMSAGGRLAVAQARFYAACVSLALKHLHAAGFLYCDLKLENVLVDADGYAKLCDFGLARRLERRFSWLACGMRDVRVVSKSGTDQYAPPEVVRGEGRSTAADWWALGVLTHEMLTGGSPFEGRSMRDIYNQVERYADGGRQAKEDLKRSMCNRRRAVPPQSPHCQLARVAEEGDALPDAAADFVVSLLEPRESSRLGCYASEVRAKVGGKTMASGNAVVSEDDGRSRLQSVQQHHWFVGLDWADLLRRELTAPWLPTLPVSHSATHPLPVSAAAVGTPHKPAAATEQQIAMLYSPRKGVLRDMPFDEAKWSPFFAPFGEQIQTAVVPEDGAYVEARRRAVEEDEARRASPAISSR